MCWAFMKRSVVCSGRNAVRGLRDLAPRVIIHSTVGSGGLGGAVTVTVTVTVRFTFDARCGRLNLNTNRLASDPDSDYVKTGL